MDDPHYRARLVERARAGALAPAVEKMLWYYAKGKPRETIDHHDSCQFASMSDAELQAALRASERLGYKGGDAAE